MTVLTDARAPGAVPARAVPSFAHLRRLTDAGGLFEHALFTQPRPEHGYCLDDVARALVVVCREPGTATEPGGDGLADLRAGYLAFVLAAQAPDGRFRNRRGADLRWRGEPTLEDCWGRALWALAATAARAGDGAPRQLALEAFRRGARHRSPWPRAMAYAALGAAALLGVEPRQREALALLVDAARTIGRPLDDPCWPWPERRLTYANALLPDALLAAGAALDQPGLVDDGLLLLGWLLDVQTRDGHLSVVPVGGRGVTDLAVLAVPVDPGFDQQPIEVAALADACARAHTVTGDRRWAQAVRLCADWFLGANDTGTPLLDAASGGGCDGLQAQGRNENQGAESTLALLSTLQQARALRSGGA